VLLAATLASPLLVYAHDSAAAGAGSTASLIEHVVQNRVNNNGAVVTALQLKCHPRLPSF